jgi:hypothetical protein
MARRSTSLAVAGLLLLSSLAAGCRGAGTPPAANGQGDTPSMLVLAGPAALPWQRLLRVSGAWVRIGGLSDLANRTAVVVPPGSVTRPSDRARLRRWVRAGGRLITSDAALVAAVGFRRGPGERMSGAVSSRSGAKAVWAHPLGVLPLLGQHLRVVSRGDTGGILVATASAAKGDVLALAVDPVTDGRSGYELLPWLGHDLSLWGATAPAPERVGTEVYLDPGGLHAGAHGTPEQIAASLGGARAVAIAGWNDDFTSASANYDYDRLITALHARGILAYAWIEPPFVSLRMWEKHPECREQNVGGRDARGDWRLLIALEAPACYAQAWQVWHRLLTRHDWDGVDVAELYFEPNPPAGVGTPYSAAALAAFGRDPAADPAGFAAFRRDLVARLTRHLLDDLNTLPGAADLELQLTIIDDTLDPTFAASLGVDNARLAEIASKGGATLQVEDPFTRWSTSPLRYEGVARAADTRMPPGAATVDLNVVQRDDGHPTAAMTGAELALAASSAAGTSGRIGVYALGTLAPGDLEAIPIALAGAAETGDGTVTAPWTVTVRAPDPTQTRLTVDGQPWPVAGGAGLIPAGQHALRWSEGSPVGPGLLRLTAELGTAAVSARTLAFTYDARARALAVLTQRALSLTVDGGPAVARQVRDPDGGWVLTLPKGQHSVTITVS